MKKYILFTILFFVVMGVVFGLLWWLVPEKKPQEAVKPTPDAYVRVVEECQVAEDCVAVRGFPDAGTFYTETSDCSTRCLTRSFAFTQEAQDAKNVCNPDLVYDPVQCECLNKRCVEL